MQALDALFRPVVARVNETIAETTPARELAAKLDGRQLALRVRRSAFAIYLKVQDGRIALATEMEDEPDVLIEGPLSGLLRLAAADGDYATLTDSGVTVSGQADLAQKFQQLLALARPDPEEELAGLVGDAVARQVGDAIRGIATWGRRSGKIMAQNVREYLQEESRELPSQYEMSRFSTDVQVLRDDVERAEARLKRLERRSDQ